MKTVRGNSGVELMLLGVMGLISSCGPMYQTDYMMTPPKSASGKACVFQCENGKYQCQQLEDLKAERCESRAQADQEACERKIAWEKGRDPKWYECGRESCDADYERCERSYRACFQACGGTVKQETRCVANCEQAPR